MGRWISNPIALLSHECKTPHILMGTYDFDEDVEREKEYYKFQLSEGVVTEVWEIS